MYRDKRSMKIVAVIHCIVNQNSRAPGAAVFPAMNTKVIEVLKKHEVGVLQMPCPEMICLGFPRSRPEGASIWDVLDTKEGRECCRKLSIFVADQIEEFLKHGFKVLAILGGDVNSPGCAVHLSKEDMYKLEKGSGVFMKELHAELSKRGIKIPFRGIRDSDPEKLMEDVNWLDNLLSKS